MKMTHTREKRLGRLKRSEMGRKKSSEMKFNWRNGKRGKKEKRREARQANCFGFFWSTIKSENRKSFSLKLAFSFILSQKCRYFHQRQSSFYFTTIILAMIAISQRFFSGKLKAEEVLEMRAAVFIQMISGNKLSSMAAKECLIFWNWLFRSFFFLCGRQQRQRWFPSII